MALMIAWVGSLHAQADLTVKSYLMAIKVQDWALAESYWLQSEIEKSNGLGIKFENNRAKYDCASPFLTNPDILNDSKYKLSYTTETIDSNSVRVDIAITGAPGSSLSTSYYLTRSGNHWLICSPMHVYSKNWHTIKTRYYNLIFTDSSLINPVAIDALDNFTDSLGRILAIPSPRMKILQEAKIDYYLCTQKQIRLLTSYDAHGMTNFPFDAIITRHLPHPHEITHLITNFALQQLPLFTLPVMQEGIACCLGGRWGKSPEAINYWGSVAISLDLARLDDILIQSGWNSCAGGADAAYAISSLFAWTLIDHHGAEKFLRIYRALSGDNQKVNAFSQPDIKMTIEQISGNSWADVASAFNSEAEKFRYCGITPGTQTTSGAQLVELNNSGISAKINDARDFYYFEIESSNNPAAAAILFYDDSANINSDYKSWQYSEQFQGSAYGGENYGLLFSAAETGLYDYLTNCLIAKYVSGFTPENNYYDPESRRLTFSLIKSKLPKNIVQYKLRFANP